MHITPENGFCVENYRLINTLMVFLNCWSFCIQRIFKRYAWNTHPNQLPFFATILSLFPSCVLFWLLTFQSSFKELFDSELISNTSMLFRNLEFRLLLVDLFSASDDLFCACCCVTTFFKALQICPDRELTLKISSSSPIIILLLNAMDLERVLLMVKNAIGQSMLITSPSYQSWLMYMSMYKLFLIWVCHWINYMMNHCLRCPNIDTVWSCLVY